jgi:DNA-binding Lrp family transcriptional regulator
MKLTDIAQECKLSSTTIRNRINLMKKSGLIVKAVMSLNMSFFGYEIPLLIGLNLDIKQEDRIMKLIKSQVIVAGIDKTIGKYDLALFVFAKNILKLEKLKNYILKQKGVKNIDINLWSKFHLNFKKIALIKKEES